MKELLSGVKRALSFGPSSRGSGSHFSDNGSQDSSWSSSFMPSPYGTVGLSRYLAHDDVLEATDGDDISIFSTEEMEKYESLPPARVWSHSCIRCELTREGWFGRRASHHPLDHRLGKTL
jgi:hypothetical protein